jgi:hypothetical protein
MHYLKLIFIFGLIAGCEHVNQRSTLLPGICRPRNNNLPNFEFEEVDVLVVLDQHGSLAVLKACPVRGFSIDFSHSQLSTRRYSSLLHHLRANAFLGIAATEMRISGAIRRASGAELRDTMVVARIISYKLQ